MKNVRYELGQRWPCFSSTSLRSDPELAKPTQVTSVAVMYLVCALGGVLGHVLFAGLRSVAFFPAHLNSNPALLLPVHLFVI